MLTFIVSRGVPTEKYLTNGVFEFDQAKALVQEGCEVVFLALDLRSIRRTRRWGLHTFTKQGVRVVELSVPLGNIPKAMFYPLGKLALRRLYHKAVKLYGRPDLLHAHFTDYAYLASLLADEENCRWWSPSIPLWLTGSCCLPILKSRQRQPTAEPIA